MTRQHHTTIGYPFSLFLAAAIGVAFAFYLTHQPQQPNRLYLPVAQNYQNPSPTPSIVLTPTPTPKASPPEVTFQISPDGTKQLTMTITTSNDASKTYTFTTSSPDGSNSQNIYSATYTADTMSIPFNTWSPDDKYVFITHTAPSGSEALALQANGDPITPTESFLNVTSLFAIRSTSNSYAQTTGWASNTLLIVNSNTPTNTKGPSYWFEVPSKAVIPLSTQFY